MTAVSLVENIEHLAREDTLLGVLEHDTVLELNEHCEL